ncbi:sphingomyelin phosphodiesterase 3 isoform X1 [Entelurus aequoreus]|uniref:sphingomyelin phosphodiesterase 3 isoform X1 n=1 Tax=Entelurus aequoreus TaxID=161455 RepID=UPI002B1E5E64|nr:sphingomyelin phosphodiesterase 3 isoform X1 [Entelurus aequoreus]XP_061878399.1 sphingomyelin phosphodiesterase 3 isoform X1 [Entelurus aequoreus]
MVLHITPYSTSCLCFLDGLSWSLVFPCYWLLDQLLASCVATSLEKRRRSRDPCSLLTLCVLFMAPLYLLLLLTSLPFALLGFIIWAPLQAVRQPYLYTYSRPDTHQTEQGETESGFVGAKEWRPQGKSFCFCSANVCLLPDSLARFNNLSNTHRRAREVGKRIRNGACRPQIKIYIDSPTNTSISATSFSSLAAGFRRTSSVDQRPDHTHTVNGPSETETEPLTECPIHPSGATGCPFHPSAGVQGSSGCPLHQDAEETKVDCPLHPVETNSSSDCPLHTLADTPDCPLHCLNNAPDCHIHPVADAPSCPLHSVADAPDCPMHSVADAPGCPLHYVADASGCPLHYVADAPGCPLHSVADAPSCPLHSVGDAPAGPMHSAGAQSGLSNHGCSMHGKEKKEKTAANCPLHTSGVQISISAPEPEPQEEVTETGNHQSREPAGGDVGSMTASKESLARYHGGDGVGVISSNNTLSHVPRTSIFKRPGRKRRHGDETFDHEISAFFPANLDFLALQEVFDHGSTTRLRQQLHRYFPYVLSDVGRYGWKGCGSSFKFLNSGLMLASRYPILDACYECYPNGRGEDALAAKGALFAKVHVGTSHQEQRIVGYLTCTHLHAIEGDAAVRCEQLDWLLRWGEEFRQASSQLTEGQKALEDLVAFDVLLGDLNFDNCSSEDKLEQQHAVFTLYKDPCRQGPGEDKPWALGTLLDPSGLYDDDVSSPENLQKVMENEEGRKEYLVFPTSKNQCHPSNQKGRKIPLKGNGRRIDYIMYSDEGLQQDWKLEVEEVSFITQLAGLTDHMPVAMRLAVATGEEES